MIPSIRQAKVQSQHQRQDEDDKHTDEEAPPLELSRAASMINAFGQLHVCLLGILDDVGGLLFGGLDHGLLDDDGFGQVLEELVELFEGALDLLDVVVASADGAED
jgi:hypothetical protein